jgi:hypothetical protein
VAIVGHYGLHGPCEDHFHFEEADHRHNFVVVSTQEEVMEYLILHFSPLGGTILDLSGNKGD